MNRRCICCRAKTKGDSLVHIAQFSSVQSLSRVRLSVTPWTAACQASLSITNSQSLNKSTTNSALFLLLLMSFSCFSTGEISFSSFTFMFQSSTGFPVGSDSKGFARFDPWIRKISWRREWQPTLVFLPGVSVWTKELGGPQFIGSQRVGYDLAANTFGHQSLLPGRSESFRFILCNHLITHECP